MKEVIRKIILCVSVIVFIYSAYNLVEIYLNYKQISDEQEEIVNEFVKPIVEEKEEEEKKEEVKVEEVILDPYERKIDFDALMNLNKDVIGWIYIPGTRIDEPILKGATNKTYLRTSIYKKYLLAGTIFIDCNDGKDFNDDKTVIYGHNMTNGTRFGQISKFLKYEFFEQHPYVYIYKPDGTMYVYDIFVSRTLEANSPLYYGVEDYNEFVSTIQDGATQIRKVSEKKSPLIFMSTCVNSDLTKRYVIAGRLKEIVK